MTAFIPRSPLSLRLFPIPPPAVFAVRPPSGLSFSQGVKTRLWFLGKVDCQDSKIPVPALNEFSDMCCRIKSHASTETLDSILISPSHQHR